jgi:hypothetical protein
MLQPVRMPSQIGRLTINTMQSAQSYAVIGHTQYKIPDIDIDQRKGDRRGRTRIFSSLPLLPKSFNPDQVAPDFLTFLATASNPQIKASIQI